MKRQAIIIELLEDCVFSASAATEGGHESLDRIPGAALLGAAAARCYRDMEKRESWRAFHSGQLRFSDGLPWNGLTPSWPAPMCWHHDKLDEYAQAQNGRNMLLPQKLVNLVHTDANKTQKPIKQLRSGYVHADGELTEPKHELRLKTAIDPQTGRASESQLFGYDALLRGQRFAAFVEADEDVEPALFGKIVNALQGERLLGRSRSAEYGRCRIEPIDLDPPVVGDTDGNNIILWLLSDLAITDADGNPTTELTPEALGLSGCRIDWRKTFLRTRRYSPWNMARGGHDSERAVLQAGGVITLTSDNGFDKAKLQRLHVNGAGFYREAGLGRIWVNPPLLMSPRPMFTATPTESATKSEPEKPDSPLIHWLEETQGIDWRDQTEQKVREIEQQYLNVLQRARRWAGVTNELDFGPSRSQWASVGNMARQKQGSSLFTALFEGDKAIIKEKGEGWNIEVPGESQAHQTLTAWLRNTLAFDNVTAGINEKHRNRAYALIIRKLADRIINRIQTRRV